MSLPIACYGSEAWTREKENINRITARKMKFMRRVAGYVDFDHKRNEYILDEIKQKPTTKKNK
jgi:hypothetical protein